MQLTPNFALEEFTNSETAQLYGIENELSDKTLHNLIALSVGLEQVRSLLGNYPITIHSGYRHPRINQLVGGVRDSDHTLGWAADITVETYTPREVAIDVVKSPLVFDQLIWYTAKNMVHLSFNPRLRREVFTASPSKHFVKGVL